MRRPVIQADLPIKTNGTIPNKRRLLLFSVVRLEDMLAKGNVWYVRHYEKYFDEVHVAYLFGKNDQTYSQGHTHLISIAGGFGGSAFDLLLAPYRLLQFARKVKPSSYLTADIVFTWWTSLFVRIMLNARIVLMPVCLPESIYSNSNRSVSGVLPIWIERIFIKLSFISSNQIIVSANAEAQYQWLSSDSVANKKIKKVTVTVEEYPGPEFYDHQGKKLIREEKEESVLLYVGRLHPEKMAVDLIEMMRCLIDWGCRVRLEIIGDGQDRGEMESQSKGFGISEKVIFHGSLPNPQTVAYYRRACIFVSTVTGTALREAGLIGTPIVAYNVDFVGELLRDGETAFLARAGDPEDLARKVSYALSHPPLLSRIGEAFQNEAHNRWPLENISRGLTEAFEGDD